MPEQDGDGDGYGTSVDCNDGDSSIHPNQTEVCNGIDDNCNTTIDEGVLQTYYGDSDGDLYGVAAITTAACQVPSGFASVAGDCNDSDAAAYPGSMTVECGIGVDYNCDGVIGVLMNSGDIFDIPITASHVQFQVTLGSTPLSTTNVTANDYGALYLRNTQTLEKVRFGDLWNIDTGTVNTVVTNSIAPGMYNVEYSVEVNGNNAPDNQGAILLENVDLTSDKVLSVDIPYVNVTTNVTLNGVAPSSTTTTASDYGKISLRDTRTFEKFPFYSAWNASTGKPVASVNTKLIPGVYDIVYEVGKDGPSWPANLETTLQRGVSIQAGTTLVINIPTVNVSATVLLNGIPISAANTNSNDYGRILMRDVESGGSFKLYNTYDTTVGAPVPLFVGQLIPGTYDVLYKGQKSVSFWPLNADTLLLSGVSITADAPVQLDLHTSKLTVSALTLAGAPLSSANTSASEYGTIRLRDSAGSSFKVADAWNGTTGAPRAQFTAPVLKGVYDLVYAFKAGGVSWPLNEKATLEAGLDLSADLSMSLDVPAVTVTCELLLSGQRPSSSNTSATDYGKLVVRSTTDEDRFKLCSAWNKTTAAPAPSVSAALLPGAYQLLYDCEKDGPNWPGNQDVVQQDDVLIVADGQLVTLDVRPSTLVLNLTLEGQPVSPTNTSATDFGLVELWSLQTDVDMFDAYVTWDTAQSTLVSSGALTLLPGAYDALYTAGADGASWPADEQRLMGCFTLR